VIYVSGPYRGDVAANIARAWLVAQGLWARGFAVICPHCNSAFMDGANFIQGDLDIIERLRDGDALYMMRGWEQSDGACLERDLAQRKGLRIYYEGVDEP